MGLQAHAGRAHRRPHGGSGAMACATGRIYHQNGTEGTDFLRSQFQGAAPGRWKVLRRPCPKELAVTFLESFAFKGRQALT